MGVSRPLTSARSSVVASCVKCEAVLLTSVELCNSSVMISNVNFRDSINTGGGPCWLLSNLLTTPTPSESVEVSVR